MCTHPSFMHHHIGPFNLLHPMSCCTECDREWTLKEIEAALRLLDSSQVLIAVRDAWCNLQLALRQYEAIKPGGHRGPVGQAARAVVAARAALTEALSWTSVCPGI